MSPFCDMSWSYSFRTRAHFFMVIRPQEKAGLESEGQVLEIEESALITDLLKC